MSDWVTIDQQLCDNCGICMIRCMLCFRREGETMNARADEQCCNLCGHCVALCPQDAISHRLLDRDNFVEVGEGVSFDTDQFISFIRQRRSHRHFKKQEIERADLEKLIDACRYAPTGSNMQSLGIIVVQDKEKIKRLSDLTVDYFEQAIEQMESKTGQFETIGEEAPDHLQPIMGMREGLKNIVKAREYGFEVIFHQAPAVMIFHAPTSTSTPKDDCVIASTTVSLAAMTMGLETCYIGLFEFAANTYQPVIEELNLPPNHKALSILILGYPKLKFIKAVDRKPMRVRWE